MGRANVKRRALAATAFVAVLVLGVLAAARPSRPRTSAGTGAPAARGGAAAAPVPAVAVADPRTLAPLTLAERSPAADELFAAKIERFVIDLNRASKAGAPADAALAGAERAITDEDARRILGDEASGALREVARAARAAAFASADDEASVEALDGSVARLDDALLARGMPYFVDDSVLRTRDGSRRLVILYEYAVLGAGLFASEATRVRTVRLRRIDRLNFSQNVLGFVNPRRATAVVLLTPIDEQVDRHVLPALADGAPMPLTSSRDVAPPAALGALGDRGGACARAELAGLEEPAIRAAFADSVERHEAQHRLDAVSPIPMPAPVEALVRGEGRDADDLRDVVKNELSAYVAQIARETRTPCTTATLLARFAANPKTRGSTESAAAVIAVDALARELGGREGAPLVERARLDEARLVRAHATIAAAPPEAINGAARRAWARLFGRPLAPLEPVP